MEIKGTVSVRNNAICLTDDNGHEIPLFSWMVSLGIRVGNEILVSVEKVNKPKEIEVNK